MDTTNRAILASGKSRNYRMVIRANSAAGHEVDGYEHLELRPDSWRRQPNLKGRNLTVGQLVWKMTVNGVTPEAAVEEYDLPLSQIEEVLAYYRVGVQVGPGVAETDMARYVQRGRAARRRRAAA